MGNIACRSLASNGAESVVIDIECHLSNNLPTIVIVGFAGKTVNEARDRLRGAFASSRLELPRRRITLNLAPTDLPKTDSGLDLAMASAILGISGQIATPTGVQAIIGELSLDGSVRPVRGIIGKLQAGRQKNLSEFFIPSSNLAQARLIPGIRLFPVDNLRQLYEHFSGQQAITAINTGSGYSPPALAPKHSDNLQLNEIVGQANAKRALTIAAAGGHNIILCGPPGTGKSMLAKALSSLLPALTHEEILEITHLYSLSSHNYDQLMTERPLRSPHHSTSHTAMVGGANLRPGEISLSHRGVLLLDELPEFSRPTLEALRQPLEDRFISVARAKANMRYPAHFILVATANPCPCGYYGTPGSQCVCNSAQLQRYQAKLSGPIFDRIDLCCNVTKVDHRQLLATNPKAIDSLPAIKRQITQARQIQAKRYCSAGLLNSDQTNSSIRQYARLTPAARQTLNQAGDHLHLSARAYIRTVKVARTIADLADSTTIEQAHISEAVRYRQLTAQSSV